MPGRVRWIELEGLMKALTDLPEDAKAGAEPIIRQNAEAAFTEIKAAYPHKSGGLADGMFTADITPGPFSVAVIVGNTAKQAGWFEYGTAGRHVDKNGAYRGAMPPGRVFRPIARRYQQQMVDQLADMVEALGATVRRGRG